MFTASTFSSHPYLESTVSLLVDYPFLGKEQLIQLLCSLELDRETAWELVTFVPLAYFRALLSASGVKFADTCVLQNRAGEAWTMSFSEQLTYQEALEYAATHLSSGMAQEQIEAVILRSCEFEDVNNLLREETPPGQIQLSPPYISIDEGEDEEEPGVGEFPKKWWEFWK
jgi:hypothetical protein